MSGSQMPLHHWPSEEGPRPPFPPGVFPQYSQGGASVQVPRQSFTQEGPRPPPNYPGPTRGPWPPQMFSRGILPGRGPPQGGFPQGAFPPRLYQGAQRMPDMRPPVSVMLKYANQVIASRCNLVQTSKWHETEDGTFINIWLSPVKLVYFDIPNKEIEMMTAIN